ncbi:MAG: hypothetical protein KAQ98_12425 [Bacteriovoracaceae bacterium]|nr:hypothetical protein [Bacteriovoracaceae bacterium]
MKIKKIIGKSLRTSIIYTLIYSLACLPVHGVDMGANTTNTVGGIIDFFGGQINQIKQQQYGNMQMMANHQQALQLLHKNQPKTVNSSKYFPGCALPPDTAFPPQNVCSTLSNPQQVPIATQMIFLSDQQTKFHDAMLASAIDGRPNMTGIACLKEAAKRHGQLFSDKIASIQNHINNYEKQTQLIKEQLKKMTDEMDGLHFELEGGKRPKNMEQKSFDMSKLFSGSSCVGFLNDSIYRKKGNGLRDVVYSMDNPTSGGKSSIRDMAGTVISDEQSIRKDIESQIQRVLREVKKYGVDGLKKNRLLSKSNSIVKGGITFGGMIAAIVEKHGNVAERHSDITSQLKKDFPGYELPALDKHFNKNVKNFALVADQFFKKKIINDCVTMEDKAGLGFSNKELIGLLYQPGAHPGTMTTRSYARKFQEILASDAYIQDKIDAIKALDKQYSNSVELKIDFTDGSSPRTPYFVLQNIIEKCEREYSREQDLSTKSGARDSRSGGYKVEEAKQLIKEIKDLELAFAGDIAKEVRNRVLDCGDVKVTSSTCSVNNPNTLTPEYSDPKSGKNFCLKTAIDCAQTVNSCHKKARQLVMEREDKMMVQSKQYNEKIMKFTAAQEKALAIIKTQVFSDMKFFKEKFPDVKMPLLEKLFVKIPDPTDTKYGVQLRGAGKMDFMKSLPKQLKQLQKALKETNMGIQKTASEYIANKQKQIQKAKKEWGQFGKSCQKKISTLNKIMAKQKQAHMKKQKEAMENMGEIGGFCTRFDSLAELHPGPGCDVVEELYTDLSKVSMKMSNSAEIASTLNQYRNLCAIINNHKEEKTDDSVANMANLCAKNNYKWSRVKKSLLRDLQQQLPPGESAKKLVNNALGKSEKDDDDDNETDSILYSKDDDDDKDEDDDDFDLSPKKSKIYALAGLFETAEKFKGTSYAKAGEKIKKYLSEGHDVEEWIKKTIKDVKKNLNTLSNDIAEDSKHKETINGLTATLDAEKLKSAKDVKEAMEGISSEIGSIVNELKPKESLAKQIVKKADKETENAEKFIKKNKSISGIIDGIPGDDDDSKNPCAVFKREAYTSAAKRCKDNTNKSTCIDDRYKKNLEEMNGLDANTQDIAVLVSEYFAISADPPFMSTWIDIGQNSLASCHDIHNAGRNDQMNGIINAFKGHEGKAAVPPGFENIIGY